jgi:hypothetical protein
MAYKINFCSTRLLVLFIIYFFSVNKTNSQHLTDNVDISFGIKTWDPVHIKVEEKTGSAFSTPIRFTAINTTYFPFKLVVDFTTFENLSPRPASREISIGHGTNNLFTLSIHVPEQGYGYSYTYEYWLTPSDEIIDERYPYLIPLKEGKMVNAKHTWSGIINDSFVSRFYCTRENCFTGSTSWIALR